MLDVHRLSQTPSGFSPSLIEDTQGIFLIVAFESWNCLQETVLWDDFTF